MSLRRKRQSRPNPCLQRTSKTSQSPRHLQLTPDQRWHQRLNSSQKNLSLPHLLLLLQKLPI